MRTKAGQSKSGKRHLARLFKFTYRNPDGKTIKSANEVESELEAEGILSSFILDKRKGEKPMETPQQADDVSLSDSSKDSDYVPPEKQAPKEINCKMLHL